MDLLRRNVFWIVCGVVAIAGVGLGVTGLRGMPEVMKEMENAAGVYKSLDQHQSTQANENALEKERERIAKIKEDYDRVLDRANQLYNYEPLVPEAFPAGPPLKLIEFRKKYAEAMDDLLKRLNCGSPATAAEIGAMKARRDNELADGASKATGDTRTAAGVLTKAGLADDPASRAAIAKALSFSCYCTPFGEEKADYIPSLQFHPAMKESATLAAPDPFDVWVAQVGYWIQKDVVDAISAVNEKASQEARAANADPWVGTLAVKDVISIRIANQFYVPAEGGLVAVSKPNDKGAALPPGTAESVFTGTRGGLNYDVIQFTLKLVMDQRDIPALIEKLSNNRFHTLVRASYTAAPPNRELKGKIYGAEPAVIAVLDFETVMLGDVFRPMMPPQVCEQFGIKCPEPAAAEGEDKDN